MMESQFSNKQIDPVCLMEVHNDKIPVVSYHSQTYHFCSEACRKTFSSDPEKYLHSKAGKRKGWWGRYLERLNKTTGGKPPQCCH